MVRACSPRCGSRRPGLRFTEQGAGYGAAGSGEEVAARRPQGNSAGCGATTRFSHAWLRVGFQETLGTKFSPPETSSTVPVT